MRDSRERLFGIDGFKGDEARSGSSFRWVLTKLFPQPKAAPAGPSTTPAPPVQPVPPVQPIQPPQPTTTELAPQPVEPTTEQPTETPAPSGSSSGFLTGDALRTAIANMEDMGFPIEEVQRAMRASFNNPDRAVEYLMNVSGPSVFIAYIIVIYHVLDQGIPAHIQAELPPPPPTQQPGQPQPQQTAINPTPAQEPAQQAAPANLFQLAQQQQQQRQHNPGGFGQGGGGLPQLSPEQWARLQELTSRNPNMSQAFIQQIAQANPELIRQLTSNPEFLSRVLEGGEPGDDDGADAIPPGATVLSVTHEERAAIERVRLLRLPRKASISHSLGR